MSIRVQDQPRAEPVSQPEESVPHLKKLAKLVRYYSLAMSTRAGSGHPTSSLSATELMVGLLFGGCFRYDTEHPEHPNNDRLIFSKGHASPLFYSLWLAAGQVSEEEIMTYRQFGSPLEGHPSMAFRYTEAATGSLGQGLSIGLGMALNAKYLDHLSYRTYVLLGDSEMSEGSQWEAIQIAAHYQLDNLVGIIDVNALGQRGETMYGHDLQAYRRRISAFGWETIPINGHSLAQILRAYKEAQQVTGRPTMIIARTIKGKGVSFVEGRNGWHGVPLKQEDFERAVKELGHVDRAVRGKLSKPEVQYPRGLTPEPAGPIEYPVGKAVATRQAYGNSLVRIYPAFPDIVSLDAEVSNSTKAEEFKEAHPDRFFEMFIAEQNMVGTALGLSRRGKIPFVSTFAAFMTRAFDQIRMSQYSDGNIKFCGSHAGVAIGADGPSQMGLEDIAMFRTLTDSVVLHPCDAVSTERLVEAAAAHRGLVYLRTLRNSTPLIYSPNDEFKIGGSKILRSSAQDVATVVAAGITVHEALAAYEELQKENIAIRVVDLYSLKPLDEQTLQDCARTSRFLLTVEDHHPEGGLGEAVRGVFTTSVVPIHSLAVRQKPKSGKPAELFDYEAISRSAIAQRVRALLVP